METFSERGCSSRSTGWARHKKSSLEPLRDKRVIFDHVVNRQAPSGLSFIMVSNTLTQLSLEEMVVGSPAMVLDFSVDVTFVSVVLFTQEFESRESGFCCWWDTRGVRILFCGTHVESGFCCWWNTHGVRILLWWDTHRVQILSFCGTHVESGHVNFSNYQPGPSSFVANDNDSFLCLQRRDFYNNSTAQLMWRCFTEL